MAKPRSAKAQQAVLQAMERLLVAGEFSSLTMERLAVEAGVSKQTIYRWWPSKIDVLVELVITNEMMQSADERPMTDDFAADLRTVYRGAVRALRQPARVQLSNALFYAGLSDPELGRALVGRMMEPFEGWLAERLPRAIADGQARSDADAEIIVELLLGHAGLASVFGVEHPDDTLDALVDIVLRGVTPR